MSPYLFEYQGVGEYARLFFVHGYEYTVYLQYFGSNNSKGVLRPEISIRYW